MTAFSQRALQQLTHDPFLFLPKRGTAREEHYTDKVKEEFGLHKRSRRIAKGVPVTNPKGEWINK